MNVAIDGFNDIVWEENFQKFGKAVDMRIGNFGKVL